MRAPERAALDLDGEWRFVPDPERVHDHEDLPDGYAIRVPGVWEAQVERPVRIITGWYHRRLTLPRDWQGGRVRLRFGAVNHACTAWLNGQLVGEHEGGYTPFAFELQGAARWGEENVLALRVVNPLNAITDFPALDVEYLELLEQFEPDLPLSEAPHGKQTWYASMSGPWQSVRLELVPQTFLESFRVLPDVAAERIELRWRLGGSEPPAGCRLEARVFDPDGNAIAEARVDPQGVHSGSLQLAIPSPRVWDIARPALYRLELRLRSDAGTGDGSAPPVDDLLVDRFGMRTIAVADGQVLLNGRAIYLLGALDQDLYPDTIWTPPSGEFLRDQFRRARELGLNLLRCHIKAPDPAYVEAADEAGILLWCELPNWTDFTPRSMRRGEETIESMLETLSNHPSIVIWTIINEDWGTEVRLEARDRRWLKRMYARLKELDPTRLVVDNSPCDTPRGRNFHMRTDLADYHTYFGQPDNAVRWREMVAELADRPRWLWSPNGDAEPTGEEPIIVSEFGNWGLPRPDRLWDHYGHQPWWFDTGRAYYRPMGLARRFTRYGLDRIWPSVDELAEATQWHQFQALQYEIGQMRRHASIAGYVITEFTDAFWEANGLLTIDRHPKAFHDRFLHVNAPDVVVADLERRDGWGGEAIPAELWLSAYSEAPRGPGSVRWELRLDDGQRCEGELPIAEWPHGTALRVGGVGIELPEVAETARGQLVLSGRDASGRERARDEMTIAVLPPRLRRTGESLRVGVHDPFRVWGIGDRVESLGHEPAELDACDLLVASDLDERLLRWVESGGRALVLVRSRDAVREELDLARRAEVHLRRLRHRGWPGQASPWEGDWINGFHWLLPGVLPDVPEAAPLDFAFEEVLPDHVLLGYIPKWHRDEVLAGMFVGWVHAPAATVWTFPQGQGWLTLTTFRLAPESGPVATAMLEGLLRLAAGRGRPLPGAGAVPRDVEGVETELEPEDLEGVRFAPHGVPLVRRGMGRR